MACLGRARWFLLALAIILVDRATKSAVEAYTTEGFHRTLIPGLASLVHTHNPGIAFGLFADVGSKWLAAILVGGSLIVIGLLGWLVAAGHAGGTTTQAGISLILGGAAGNLIDRLVHGGVTDFFEVGIGRYRWPAFNVADSAITIGAALVVIELLLSRSPHREEPADKSTTDKV